MLSLGIDVGTSGIRAMVLDDNSSCIAYCQKALPDSQALYSSAQQIIGYSQQPADWWCVFSDVLRLLKETLELNTSYTMKDIQSLAIDGTSGTVLLADRDGRPCSEALMYNDQRAVQQAQAIRNKAEPDTAATGVTSGLAKILWLYEQGLHQDTDYSSKVFYALNQSDWLSGRLMAEFGHSDYNNALKMGYDAEQQCWPQWLSQLLETCNLSTDYLPLVHPPGEILGVAAPDMVAKFGFHPDLKICAGTTDSTAAIMATGAKDIGDAITSLGSTLVMKVIADKPLYNQQYGVYSQPYGDKWLIGGASNSGGAVLKALFCAGEISDLTEQLNQQISHTRLSLLNLNYYPLLTPGERFPVQDPALKPVLTPRPDRDIEYFQAILEGMADIETRAYRLLLELGAPYPKHVSSIGGGANNGAWRYIREQKLGIPVCSAKQQEAAAGTALLARTHFITQEQ